MAENTITFRALTPDDYELAETFKRATFVAGMVDEGLFEQFFPAERSYRMLLARLQAFDTESCVLVLVDGLPVGHLDLWVGEAESGPVGYLNNIYLVPEWRGKGLGEVMDGWAMRFFRKHGVSWVTLRTRPQREKVVAFYERLGWRYLEDGPNGMIVMGKDVV